MSGIPNRVTCVALVLAPTGRDATVAGALLRDAGVASVSCASLADLDARLGDDVSFLVIADEVLQTADLRPLSQWVSAQPSWSDLPIIILSAPSHAPSRSETQRLADILGNVTLIERPFHTVTFVSIAKAAFKGRLRQYEARARIEELRESEERLEQRSGEAALDVLRAGEKIDLMITDFSMPKMNGAQLVEAARRLQPGLAVLLATGYAELPSGTQISIPRIAKPYQQAQLASAVSEAVKARAHV